MNNGKVDRPVQTVLGKYEIRDKISAGSMSTVYDGWDVAINRRVAIKAVPLAQTGQSDEWQHLARFKREAQAAGQLQHPTVVAIFDYGETEEYAFIIMEFVDGGTLKAALEAGTQFSTAEIARLMQDILTGLQYSHDRGIVHRDIKPANIMLTSDRHAKIADFGIARVEDSDITQVGMMMGTPAYMSPEQFRGETISASTDIYSAGVILYQLLTSERPFDGGLATIMHKALSIAPPKPSDVSRTAPRSLDDVVARAMSKQPGERFKDAREFAQAIQKALAVRLDEPVTRSIAAQRVHGPLKREATSRYIYLAGAALLVGLVAGGYWVWAPGVTSNSEAILKRSAPRTVTMSTPAAPALAKQDSPVNSPTPAASPDFARTGSTSPTSPADLTSEPPAASRDVAPAEPTSLTVAPLSLEPDFSARERFSIPPLYPIPQPPVPPGVPSAPPDAPRLLRGPHKDARNPLLHSVPKATVPARSLGTSDANAQRGANAATPVPPTEPDNTPANAAPPSSPDVVIAPKFYGRIEIVNGVRKFIPAESDPPK